MVSGDSGTSLTVHPDVNLIDDGVLASHDPLKDMALNGQVISNCTKDVERDSLYAFGTKYL